MNRRDAIKAARFLVSDDLLHEVLRLPQGCQITHLTFNHERHAYELSVRGDESSGLPTVRECGSIPLVTPHYKDDGSGPVFGGWS